MTTIDEGLTRQQLCATMHVSESTVRRWELQGLPYTPIGTRGKRYHLAECKKWLREAMCQSGQTRKAGSMLASWPAANAFTAACRKVHLRVLPSH